MHHSRAGYVMMWQDICRESVMKTLFAAAVLGTILMAGGSAMACGRPADAAGVESRLAAWINAERGRKGLGKLGMSETLHNAALAHACDMAKRGYFSHEGPGGPGFKARIGKTGYRTAVENIAKTRGASADTAAGMWRKSSAHWQNILNRKIGEMGVAVATDGTDVFYVFIGGRK